MSRTGPRLTNRFMPASQIDFSGSSPLPPSAPSTRSAPAITRLPAATRSPRSLCGCRPQDDAIAVDGSCYGNHSIHIGVHFLRVDLDGRRRFRISGHRSSLVTYITASQIWTAYSGSVPMKLSAILVDDAGVWHRLLERSAKACELTAMSTTPPGSGRDDGALYRRREFRSGTIARRAAREALVCLDQFRSALAPAPGSHSSGIRSASIRSRRSRRSGLAGRRESERSICLNPSSRARRPSGVCATVHRNRSAPGCRPRFDRAPLRGLLDRTAGPVRSGSFQRQEWRDTSRTHLLGVGRGGDMRRR